MQLAAVSLASGLDLHRTELRSIVDLLRAMAEEDPLPRLPKGIDWAALDGELASLESHLNLLEERLQDEQP